MNSSYQYQRKFIVKSLENMDIEVNPLTPVSDQDRISPHNINTISSRQLMNITALMRNLQHELTTPRLYKHDL